MLLFLNSLSHMLVDALCSAAVLGQLDAYPDLAAAVIAYNTLAFSTQCLVGLVTDRLKRHGFNLTVSAAMVIAGYLTPSPWILKILLLGLGNSLFHVEGGTLTLMESGGKPAKLGVFVAPGCVGLTVGALYPECGIVFAPLLALCATGAVICAKRRCWEPLPEPKRESGGLFAVMLLTCAVAVRAVGGCAVSFPWKTGAAAAVCLTLSVFVGKTAGGFVCERLGARKTAIMSIVPASALIAFFPQYMLPSLLGQMLLNLSMPVTLWLIYRRIPESPGFAFGLAASALWPGTLAGQLMRLTGPSLLLCVAASFALGLFAIFYSCRGEER